MKQVHEIAYSLVNDLLRKLNPDFTQALYTGDQDIATLLEILASEMADYIDEVNRAQEVQFDRARNCFMASHPFF